MLVSDIKIHLPGTSGSSCPCSLCSYIFFRVAGLPAITCMLVVTPSADQVRNYCIKHEEHCLLMLTKHVLWNTVTVHFARIDTTYVCLIVYSSRVYRSVISDFTSDKSGSLRKLFIKQIYVSNKRGLKHVRRVFAARRLLGRRVGFRIVVDLDP